MKKISSFGPELLPYGARCEHKGNLPKGAIALRRLPAGRPNVNLFSIMVGSLLLRA
jgi:hypothetical protein